MNNTIFLKIMQFVQLKVFIEKHKKESSTPVVELFLECSEMYYRGVVNACYLHV